MLFIAIMEFGATLFPMGMVAVANPEIGFFRDWDAFSFVAIPFTVFLFFLLRDHCANTNILAQVGILLIGGAVIHTLLWMGIHVSKQKSLQRFEAILNAHIVPPIASAFSWETLGIYYRQQNDLLLAQKAYENALKHDPHNARYLNGLGIFYHKKNDTKHALAYFRQALEQNSKLPAVQANIGDIFFQHSQYDSAQYYYEQAIKNGLTDIQLYHNLGNTYQALGDMEQAQKWFDRSR
ncbi:MAG: tetratricopeptide repeat protein [Candidatus Latescibacterota bacterium]